MGGSTGEAAEEGLAIRSLGWRLGPVEQGARLLKRVPASDQEAIFDPLQFGKPQAPEALLRLAGLL